MIVTIVIMLAFAAIHALVATMLTEAWPSIMLALRGAAPDVARPERAAAYADSVAASRCCNRA
ncbi:hypothetical protein [Polymorphobacter fuscus]|uniref:Uncharacterized protein n=1 Tax=Sandarakinorhabdus fusca TaxID=1439888 RepID=A0A7C9KL73_9SPHN|nr:hypothetical protein [Polymorphobacter fuscus]KAB7648577.1 hypothetical protein F9290_02460 [Polymorphobacter fuscus]MQT16124.1 hypothetical protein [Polymorphobacter fuscus]NJC07597.1 hypothetical protein [Polymorphobacter fuscus]